MNHFKVFLAGAVVASWVWQLISMLENRPVYPVHAPDEVACSTIANAGHRYCSCSNCAMNPVSAVITADDRKL